LNKKYSYLFPYFKGIQRKNTPCTHLEFYLNSAIRTKNGVRMSRYRITVICILLLTTISLSSCYRFPEDGECSVVPATNNPSITRNQGASALPGSAF